MHLAALLTLVTAFIPAVTPVPAPSPESAEIDIHLELTNSKEGADFTVFNEPTEAEAKAKTITDPVHYDYEHDTEQDTVTDASRAVPVDTLPYSFILNGDLIQGLLGPKPLYPYFEFPSIKLGESGVLSVSHASTFTLRHGKLLIGPRGGHHYAVGLRDRFIKSPVPAVLVHPTLGLNFTAKTQPDGHSVTLYSQDQRFTFLGSKFVSWTGSRVEFGLKPQIQPHPTIISWKVVRVGNQRYASKEEEIADNQASAYEEAEYDQDVLAEI